MNNRSPRLSRILLSAIALPALAVLPAIDAPAQTGTGPRTGNGSASNAIIPLPLNPVIPAAQRVCTSRTPSGLGYTILRAAEGPKPTADDTVLVNYIGYIAATGAVFDQAMQTPMPVNQVVPGFSQGLQLVGKGGIIRLCIPASLGYGAQASGPIPANADLVFQVEMLDFKTAAEIAEMRKAAQADAPKPTQP